MKLLFLCLLSISLFGDKLKFNDGNKVVETINITDKNIYLDFKILCIKGNQYLYLVGSNANPTQMFKRRGTGDTIPLECNEYEDKQ